MGENKERVMTAEDIIKASERILNQKYVKLPEEYDVTRMDEEKLNEFVAEHKLQRVKPNIYANMIYSVPVRADS